MKIKNLAIATLVALGSLIATEANASCSISGKIERVYTNSNATYAYVIPLTAISNSYYHYFYTTDDTVAAALQAAKADGNAYVNVNGSASTCPTTGTARFGGVISSFTRY